MQINILYADDEIRYHRLVKMFLQEFNYDIKTFTDGLEVLDYLSTNNRVDLVILDVMMPNLNGWETCKFIQENLDIPVIMLTALEDENSEEYGFNIGADDYISKPFSKKILSARVNAILRRTLKHNTSILDTQGIIFNEVLTNITVDTKDITLTNKEYELLKYLVLNKNIVLTRESLLNNVWGIDYYGAPRTVDTHIKSLRSKLDSFKYCIKTIRGSGYSFIGVNS